MSKEIIENTNPDLVVSVHMNKYSLSTRRGAQVFYKQNDENKAFRNLRTNLESNFEDGMKAVMLTDLQSNSGKGYVAANLARVFALKQKRVALINFDENDKIFLNLIDKNESGVYDYLSEKDSSWQNFIYQENR